MFGVTINVKDMVKKKYKVRCGMKRALDLVSLPMIGTHHRGIDDARNIANLFLKLI